jgi:uncharacterized CHY-type Zn-finger protein
VTVPDSAPLHQVTCPHCLKINTTTALTKKRCTFCKKYFDPGSGAKKPVQKNKYNAQQVTIGSVTFDSKVEGKWYFRLKNDPDVTGIEVHPQFELIPAFQKCYSCNSVFSRGDFKKCPSCSHKLKKFRATNYTADFKVTYKDGHVEVQDVKGAITRDFLIRKKLFEAAYPALTIRIMRVK